jgi:hypothetical protein
MEWAASQIAAQLGALPVWAQLALGLLAAATLFALNIGWFLQAKALADDRARKRSQADQATKR